MEHILEFLKEDGSVQIEGSTERPNTGTVAGAITIMSWDTGLVLSGHGALEAGDVSVSMRRDSAWPNLVDHCVNGTAIPQVKISSFSEHVKRDPRTKTASYTMDDCFITSVSMNASGMGQAWMDITISGASHEDAIHRIENAQSVGNEVTSASNVVDSDPT
ncbi:MAG: type VI protein secretion system component Hcp [Myxococcota bacterium]